MLDRFRFKPAFFKRQEDSMNRIVAESFKIKTVPSHYPQFPFRLLQVVQLICAITVIVIMFWFIYHLRDSSIAVPWKFIFLVVVSLLTILTLIANILIYLPTSPPPLQNAFLSGSLLLFWTAAFALLANAMKWTLQRACAMADWDTDTGMSVCRVYKVLFAFALAEIPATFLALCLDLVVRRQETFSGAYMRTADPQQGQYDPYSESKRLTEAVPSPRVLAAGYGLRKDEKMESPDEGHMEMDPLNEVGPKMLRVAYRAPSGEEGRYDDEGEDIAYHQSGGESVHDIMGA